MSNRQWSKYIKIPQPVLTQGNGLGNQIQVQQRSRDIYWLDTNDHNAQSVLYLSGLLDIAGVTGGPIACGTLSARYILLSKSNSKTPPWTFKKPQDSPWDNIWFIYHSIGHNIHSQ